MSSPSWGFVGGPGSFAYRLFDALRGSVNDRLVSWLMSQTSLANTARTVRILEAGSGPAGGSSAFRRCLPGGTIVALDIDRDALGEARQRDPGLAAVVGDIHRLPFADGTFDLVWNSSTLEHLPAIEPAIAEMARVTAPEGHTFVGVPYRWGPLAFQPLIRSTPLGQWLGDVWSRADLSQRMQANGLAIRAELSYFLRFFVGVLGHPLPTLQNHMPSPPSGATRDPGNSISPLKKTAFWAITIAVVLIVPEITLRGYLAAQYGARLFLYGTAWSHFSKEFGAPDPELPTLDISREIRTVRDHELLGEGFGENPREGYSKYFPNQVKSDIDESFEQFEVSINNHGFRGRNFVDSKAPGIIRVVTLGASSTFGFHNRDNETYPAYLQDALDRAVDGRRYEVINLGIPHLRSARIHSLFVHEALPLNPDVVTFYEGYNDAVAALKGEVSGAGSEPKPTSALIDRLKERSLIVALLADSLMIGASDWRSASTLDRMSINATREILTNLDRIAAECARRGIVFIATTQQSRSLSVDASQIRGMSFAREVALLTTDRSAIKGGIHQKLTFWDAAFLIHHAINESIRSWTADRNIPLVDVVDLLDTRRDLLLSWVHLKPGANKLIAQDFSDTIRERLRMQKP